VQLKFDISREFSFCTDDKSFNTHVDLISAKSLISQLQLKLDSLETSRKRARIEHDRDIDQVKKGCQVKPALTKFLDFPA
jgi:hypothetical protein